MVEGAGWRGAPAVLQRTLGLRIKLFLCYVNDVMWFVCYCSNSYPILTDSTPLFHQIWCACTFSKEKSPQISSD